MATIKDLENKLVLDVTRLCEIGDLWEPEGRAESFDVKEACVREMLSDKNQAVEIYDELRKFVSKSPELKYVSSTYALNVLKMLRYFIDAGCHFSTDQHDVACDPSEQEGGNDYTVLSVICQGDEHAWCDIKNIAGENGSLLHLLKQYGNTNINYRFVERYGLERVRAEIAKLLGPSQHFSLEVRPCPELFFKMKCNCYGHKPWVITQMLPVVVVQLTNS